MIHYLHLVTAASYVVVGAVLFGAGLSYRIRSMKAVNEGERTFNYLLVGIFVYACAIDHAADALHVSDATKLAAGTLEAVVSAATAAILAIRIASRWRKG